MHGIMSLKFTTLNLQLLPEVNQETLIVTNSTRYFYLKIGWYFVIGSWDMNTRNSDKGNLVSQVYGIENKRVVKKAAGPRVCFVFMNCVRWLLYEEILVWWPHVSSRKLGLLNHSNNNLIIGTDEWCQYRFIFSNFINFYLKRFVMLSAYLLNARNENSKQIHNCDVYFFLRMKFCVL